MSSTMTGGKRRQLPRERKEKRDWLTAGLTILCAKGEQTLTIDALCRDLTMTKGSFYHHFRDREDYCNSLLAFIEESDTSKVILRAERAGRDPKKRILALTARTENLRKDFEPALRAWALRDEMARRTLERIDRRRIEYLGRLFTESGLSHLDARMRARIVYALYLGAAFIQPPLKGIELRSFYRNMWRK